MKSFNTPPQGVQIRLLNADKSLHYPCDSNGQVHETFRNGDKLSFEVSVTNPNCHVFTSDGNKNIVMLKNIATDEDSRQNIRRYRKAVNVYGDQVTYTRYAENHLRLLILNDGNVSVWDVSLISQDGAFFFITQEVYSNLRIYRSHNRVVCPDLYEWPQFENLLNDLISDSASLPPVKEYEPLPIVRVTKPYHGKVLWFNLAQGVGSVMTNDGQAKVYWRQIIHNGNSLAMLNPGDEIVYQNIKPARQYGDHPTKFQWELEGVKVVA